jgi:hypothetical protein
MNITEVEKRLKQWGGFWADKHKGDGWATTSMTEQCIKIMRTGIYSQGTSHLFSSMSDNIFVPDYIQEIDEAAELLTPEEKKWINEKYILNANKEKAKKIDNIYTRRAEVKISCVV